MNKKIKTYVLTNMLDTRMNSCLCKMTKAMNEKDYKIRSDESGGFHIIWDNGHFSFPSYNLMFELKKKLQTEEEIDVDENTFTIAELTQLLKACDNSEVRSHLVDCMLEKTCSLCRAVWRGKNKKSPGLF